MSQTIGQVMAMDQLGKLICLNTQIAWRPTGGYVQRPALPCRLPVNSWRRSGRGVRQRYLGKDPNPTSHPVLFRRKVLGPTGQRPRPNAAQNRALALLTNSLLLGLHLAPRVLPFGARKSQHER